MFQKIFLNNFFTKKYLNFWKLHFNWQIPWNKQNLKSTHFLKIWFQGKCRDKLFFPKEKFYNKKCPRWEITNKISWKKQRLRWSIDKNTSEKRKQATREFYNMVYLPTAVVKKKLRWQNWVQYWKKYSSWKFFLGNYFRKKIFWENILFSYKNLSIKNFISKREVYLWKKF